MRLERYISELLYRYQCVTVPGLGSFLAQHQSAQIDEGTYTFVPPSKKLSFNAQLTSNDGLLVKHIAAHQKKAYESVLEEVETQVDEWKRLLQNQEKVTLKNIGVLWQNEEEKIQFQPAEEINYLTSSFGLSAFVSPAVVREELKEQVTALEEKAPILFTPEKKEAAVKERFPYLKYAAVFLLTISTGLTGYTYLEDQKLRTEQMVSKDAQRQIEHAIQEATFFNTTPLEIPTIKLNVNKAPERYHIIAGAFRVKANAQKKIKQLQAKGYSARAVGVNKYGLHQVAYGSFADVNQALSFLQEIKATESADAWLLVADSE